MNNERSLTSLSLISRKPEIRGINFMKYKPFPRVSGTGGGTASGDYSPLNVNPQTLRLSRLLTTWSRLREN